MASDWEQVKHHFAGHPEDLVEVFFFGMTPESWERLFEWLKGKDVRSVQTQHGYIEPEELDCAAFLSGKLSFIPSFETATGIWLPLCIIEEDYLDINVELGEVQSGEAFADLASVVNEIAGAIDCSKYIICPEFKKDQAFFINGKVVVP